MKWAVRIDHALAYDDTSVFIYDKANDDNGTNEVLVNDQLANTGINIPKAPNITGAATEDDEDKTLEIGETTTIVVSGSDLVGEFRLEKNGQDDLDGLVKVKRTNANTNVSDLTEAKVTIFVPDSESTGGGWTLAAENEEGTSDIGGFSLVDENN